MPPQWAVIGITAKRYNENFFKIKLLASDEKKFIYYFLISQKTQYLILRLAGTSTIPDLNHGDFYRIKIGLPPLPEQRAIADCLSTWDRAIQTLTQLIAQRELRKKWLMQQLLTGKKRLPGFGGEWKEWFLSDILVEPQKLKVKDPAKHELLTVKLHCKGIERTGKYPNTTKNGRPYYRREKGELLVGRQNFHNGGFGIVKQAESGLIASNAISSVISRSKISIFLVNKIFSLHSFHKRVGHILGGTGQKEISSKEFFKLKMKLPPTTEEQTAIAQVLQRADQEITLLNHKLTHLQDQKKGLMQQLLTGKKRLTLNNE